MLSSLEINIVVWTYCILKSLNKKLWVTVPFSGGTCELYTFCSDYSDVMRLSFKKEAGYIQCNVKIAIVWSYFGIYVQYWMNDVFCVGCGSTVSCFVEI